MTITTAGIAVPFLVERHNTYVMDGTLVRRAVYEPWSLISSLVGVFTKSELWEEATTAQPAQPTWGHLCENRERTNVPLLVLPHYSSEKGSARADIQGRNRCGDDKCLKGNWWHER
jgi:hypothetical protein